MIPICAGGTTRCCVNGLCVNKVTYNTGYFLRSAFECFNVHKVGALDKYPLFVLPKNNSALRGISVIPPRNATIQRHDGWAVAVGVFARQELPGGLELATGFR